MLEKYIKSTLLLIILLQSNFLFSQVEIKKDALEISKPKYNILIDYLELSVLTSAMVDGISKYKGNIEFETNAICNGNQVSWEISTSNKQVFEVLNLYVAQKSLSFLKTINLESSSPIEKASIASISALSTKLDDALKNPVWDIQKLSGILRYISGQYLISTDNLNVELSGVIPDGSEIMIGKKVIVTGFIKEPGKIELKSIHIIKENTIELFIMSQCPFGNQALRYVFDKIDKLTENNKMKLEIHYIFSKNGNSYTSLHGEQEIIENMVQIILRDQYPRFFTGYLKQRISNPSGSWQQITENLKLDNKVIRQIDNEIETNRDSIIQSEYSYMLENFQLINSSPTFIWENEIKNSIDEVPGFNMGDHYSEIQKCVN